MRELLEIELVIVVIIMGMIFGQLQRIHTTNRRLLRAIAMMVSMMTGPLGGHDDEQSDPDIEYAIKGKDDDRWF